MAITCAEDETQEAAFSSAIGAYTENNNYPIHTFHYYPDRDLIEIEYRHHPMDPKPPNTRHASNEFGDVLSDLFGVWRGYQIAKLTNKLAEEAEQEFNLTDNSIIATGT